MKRVLKYENVDNTQKDYPFFLVLSQKIAENREGGLRR